MNNNEFKLNIKYVYLFSALPYSTVVLVKKTYNHIGEIAYQKTENIY